MFLFEPQQVVDQILTAETNSTWKVVRKVIASMLALAHTLTIFGFTNEDLIKKKKTLPCGKTTTLDEQTCHAHQCANSEKRLACLQSTCN